VLPNELFSFSESEYASIPFSSYIYEKGTSSVNDGVMIYRYDDTLIAVTSHFTGGLAAQQTFALTQEQGDAFMAMVKASQADQSEDTELPIMGGEYEKSILNDGKDATNVHTLNLSALNLDIVSWEDTTITDTIRFDCPSDTYNSYSKLQVAGHAPHAVFNCIDDQVLTCCGSNISSIEEMTIGEVDTLMILRLDDGSKYQILVTNYGYVIRIKELNQVTEFTTNPTVTEVEPNISGIIEEPVVSTAPSTEPLETGAAMISNGNKDVHMPEYVMVASTVDGVDTSYYYDDTGHLIREESPEIGKVVAYDYNSAGNLTAVEEIGLIHYCTEYDANENPTVRYQYIVRDGMEQKLPETTYEYFYDASNRVETIIRKIYQDGTVLIGKEENSYRYNSNGTYSISSMWSEPNNEGYFEISAYTITTYNAQGYELSVEHLDSYTVANYSYDEHWNVETAIFTTDKTSIGGDCSSLTYHYDNTYDEDGRLIRVVRSEAEGNINDSFTPIIQNEFEYDAYGNLILERTTYLQNGIVSENTYRYATLSGI